MKTVIRFAPQHPTLRFAAQELARYLRLATGTTLPIVADDRLDGKEAVLRLCLEGAAGSPADFTADDRFSIEPEGRGYRLCGSNPRSVLFAVYRYLRELGFRWLRPGARGEIVPKLTAPIRQGIRIRAAPDCRYRTICIEGAASREHVIDLIDWQAKQGMNGYFIQFEYGTEFWARWYEHRENRYWRKEPLSPARVKRIVADVTAEIAKRGLRFERMGHGWTCAALGITGEGWGKSKDRVPVARRDWVAAVKGKRDLWGGVALNTNLCYSKPRVRQAMTDAILAYAKAHPEVDALHLWLADGCNNNCECAGCRRARPADFYVEILNELDARLTAAGLPTKIVFLVYVDLFWPPVRRRIAHPERFILMFAPITRSYRESFAAARRARTGMTPYVRNKLEFPRGAAANLAYLRGWQQEFKGDGFDFDYHAIWACYFDLAMFTIARTLHQDIRNLGAVGLHGFNSCQNQRMSFPHNLLMDVMARTLWDNKASFERIVADSFADAYGPDGRKAAAFFAKMSALGRPFFEPVYHYGKDRRRIVAGRRNLPRMRALVRAFRSVARRNERRTRGAVQWSWKYLNAYLDLMERLLPAYAAYLARSKECRARFERAFEYLRRREKTLHPALDVWTCQRVLTWRVNEMEEAGKKSSA